MKNLIDAYLIQFNHFYVSDARNSHVDFESIKLYTRKSKRAVLIDELFSFIDIASITIDPDHQKKGIFTALLKGLLEKYPKDNFFIESIVNDNVRKVAERQGFKIKPHNIDVEQGYDMYLIR